MLNGLETDLALELSRLLQEFDTQSTQSAVLGYIAKFLEILKAFDFRKILKKSKICTQIRLILKEFHNDNAPRAQGHKGQYSEYDHRHNV